MEGDGAITPQSLVTSAPSSGAIYYRNAEAAHSIVLTVQDKVLKLSVVASFLHFPSFGMVFELTFLPHLMVLFLYMYI